ncbi:hypothetical protein JCM17961_21700 [Endothiovibrio diazotrophicus]
MLGIYTLLCALLAVAGRDTRIGAMGTFLLALLFTPLAVGIVLTILRPMPKPRPQQHDGRC